MKKIYIHCGTHKTGTTSLQEFLSLHRDHLKANGFLYPSSGQNTALNGHHNIAWEMERGRLYRKAYGTISDLIAEISKYDGNVILSTEGFENSLCHQERWADLFKDLKSLGFSITFVIYLRNQVSYFESLYAQLLNGGHGRDYLMLAKEICSAGKLAVDGAEFQFDYFHLIGKLREYRDADFILGNFHELKGRSMISDFLSRLGIAPPSDESSTQLVRNRRGSLYDSFVLFYQNRKGRKITVSDNILLSSLFEFLQLPYRRSSFVGNCFKDAFFESNRKVAELYPSLNFNDYFSSAGNEGNSIKSINLQRLFSFETYAMLREIAIEMRSLPFFIGILKERLAGSLFDSRLRAWSVWVTDD